MKWRPLVLVTALLVACGGAAPRTDTTTPAARTTNDRPSRVDRAPEVLLDEVTSFAARVSTATHPSPGTPDWLVPPTETELSWVTDRRTPMPQRMERSQALLEGSVRILHAYFDSGGDPSGGLPWLSSLIRQQSALLTVMLDEFVPTLRVEDPTYAVRMDGLRGMARGSVEMLVGVTSVLGDPRLGPDPRVQLVDAVRDHIRNYDRIWTREERAQVETALAEAQRTERDPEVATALGEARAALAPTP